MALTVEAWRKRFNQLFVREIPASVAQLETGIGDLAVAEHTVHEARAHGLDREVQFVEDRRKFLYHQALDLFEKEQLRPRVEVTASDTETYYRAHLAEFARPVRARGTIWRFANMAIALEWLQRREFPPNGDQEIEVSEPEPLPGAGAGVTDRLLRLPDGAPSGPIAVGTGVVVFLKRNTVTEPEPHAAAAEKIRAKLTQPKLEALEATLAWEWAQRHAIEDHLNPEEFGVPGPVQKPWPGSN